MIDNNHDKELMSLLEKLKIEFWTSIAGQVQLLRLEPGVKTRKKANLRETDSKCLLWIAAQLSALIARKKCIGGVGESYWLTGNQ